MLALVSSCNDHFFEFPHEVVTYKSFDCVHNHLSWKHVRGSFKMIVTIKMLGQACAITNFNLLNSHMHNYATSECHNFVFWSQKYSFFYSSCNTHKQIKRLMVNYCLASKLFPSLQEDRDFFLAKDSQVEYSLFLKVMLTKMGPNVSGTLIDNKRRTRITPT